MDVGNIIKKVKELIKKGNVSRIIVKHKNEVVLNLPVNAGVVGTVVGLTYAKWAVLAAVLATLGFGCTVELVRDNGSVVNVVDEERSQKVRDFAADTVEKVKENIPIDILAESKDESNAVDADVYEMKEDNDITQK